MLSQIYAGMSVGCVCAALMFFAISSNLGLLISNFAIVFAILATIKATENV